MISSLAFLESLLKDIKAERPHITEKDNLRLLFITKWFLEHYLAYRKDNKWAYDLVGEVVDRGWVVWVLKRMRNAMDEKVNLIFLLQEDRHRTVL